MPQTIEVQTSIRSVEFRKEKSPWYYLDKGFSSECNLQPEKYFMAECSAVKAALKTGDFYAVIKQKENNDIFLVFRGTSNEGKLFKLLKPICENCQHRQK